MHFCFLDGADTKTTYLKQLSLELTMRPFGIAVCEPTTIAQYSMYQFWLASFDEIIAVKQREKKLFLINNWNFEIAPKQFNKLIKISSKNCLLIVNFYLCFLVILSEYIWAFTRMKHIYKQYTCSLIIDNKEKAES